MTEYDWLVVADDLTGANDTGHQFAAAGYETRVLPGFAAELPPADALVVNTDSRTVSPDAATERIREALSDIEAEYTYKKVDSTLRGNLTAELDALVAETSAPLVLVAPAFPSNDRDTVNGTHLVDGLPVGAAESVQERENPPDASRVPVLLDDVSARVERLALETVQEGTEAVIARLTEVRAASDDPVIVVCDATTDAHLETIAEASLSLDRPPCYVGSAGFAGKLAGLRRETPERRVLGVVGSTNERTFAQLRAVPDGAVSSLDTRRALDSPTAAGGDLGTEAAAKLREDGVAVVTSARTQREVTRTYEYGDRLGLDRGDVRDRIETALTAALETVRDTAPVDGMFATGGATATAALGTLEAADVRLTGDAVAEGVPIAAATTASGDELALVTKAGGFGSRTAIVDCLRALGASVESVD